MPRPSFAFRTIAAVGLALAAAGALPETASAHGPTAPVATSFVARLTGVPAGVEAKVVDGDQRLWLRVDPRLTLVVLGFQGEPYLRFSPIGVAVNERSPAYYLNRSRPLQVPGGDFDPRATPSWHRVGHANAYSWHENRLHALARAARAPGSELAGRRTLPLRIDGRPAQITFELLHRPDPSLVWFSPLALVIGSLVVLLGLKSPRVEAGAMNLLTLVTLAAFVVGRAGRDFYGRPTVSNRELVGFGLTCLFALVVALGFRSREWRTVAAMLVGAAGLYEGLALIRTLLHGYVLSALPANLERGAAAASLAAGAGLLLMVVAGNAFPDQLTGSGRSRSSAANG